MLQDLLLTRPHFSFLYNGELKNGFEPGTARIVTELPQNGARSFQITYSFPFGIQITEELALYDKYNAARVLLHFENVSDENSGTLSKIQDCDITLPFNEHFVHPKPGHRFTPPDKARVFRFNGSNWARDEFAEYPEYIAPGKHLKYACEHGRSSQGLLPFFEINENDRGILLAIGWTGQWNISFAAQDGEINIQSGIEDTEFYLKPGEKIRTSSTVIMPYANGREKASNQWRRFFKEYISPMGKAQRPAEGPLATGAWGSLSSERMLEVLKTLKEKDIGAEYYWIDAGWYGYSTGPCPTEFDGDWPRHTGSWVVNKTYHPDGLEEVARVVKENGMGLVLWIEPERVIRGTDTPNAHPDWFMELSPDNDTLLIDFSIPEAVQGTADMVAGFIEKLNLKIYRQDFNTNPLPYWRKYDEEGRRGLKEIQYIMGLYRFWDTLLERFPYLLIDNCASGGRRLDIEMLSRSIPLWRSDYQCTFDHDIEVAQIHTTGLNRWLPFHGTGVGRYVGDAYRFRSAYAPSMTSSFWQYEENPVTSEEEMQTVKKYFAEYKSVRPYLSCDFYALVENSLCNTSWCVWQYDRPEEGDGILIALRRPNSSMTTAELPLKGLSGCGETRYILTDADSGQTWEESEANLKEGLQLTLSEKPSSRLIRYKKA